MCTLVKFWKTPQNRTISVTILVQSAQNLVEIVRFGGSLSKLYQWALENDTNNWRTKPFLNILPVFLAIHFRKHVFFLILTLRTFSMNSDIVHLKWLILMTHFKGSGKTRVLLSNPRALFFGSIWHTESDGSFINFKFRSRDGNNRLIYLWFWFSAKWFFIFDIGKVTRMTGSWNVRRWT